MVVRLVGAATLVDGSVDVRVGPALVDRHHPLAAVDGPFNAVMLQGDAIREITLEGPGAGGIETASAVVADMVSVIGTTGTGFLQNDACYRELPKLPEGELASPFYVRVEVADRPGVLALVALRFGRAGRLDRAADAVAVERARRPPHRHARGARRARWRERSRRSTRLDETRGVSALAVIPDRGVTELGWASLTLGEGNTPLLPAPRLSERLGASSG